MFESGLDEMDAAETLAFVLAQRRCADEAEARLVEGVAHFLDLNAEVPDPEDWWVEEIGGQREIPLAGVGTPGVAEFALADLAATLKLTEGATRSLAGDVLELRHRLPRVWARIHDGSLPAWKGRKVAEQSTGLSLRAVDWLDRQVAPVAHKIGFAALMRLVAAAVMACDPLTADAERDQVMDERRVRVFDPDERSMTTIIAEIDAPDGMALDRALSRGAAALAALGDESSHDVRRAKTLGILADPQAALDLFAGKEPLRRTEVVLHVHLDEAALLGDRGVALVEGLAPLPLQTIRDWCADPGTQVIVKPVIDARVELVSEGYEPTDKQREQVMLRDCRCVFPWCDKTGRNHDLDHIEDYDDAGPPGQTRSTNLARLCRFHHRVKTHGHWRYERLSDGTYLWTNLHGHHWVVDSHGTTALNPEVAAAEAA